MTEMMEFFRKTGSQGGKKRAAGLTPARRSAIAKKAAKARWDSKKAAAPTKAPKTKAKAKKSAAKKVAK